MKAAILFYLGNAQEKRYQIKGNGKWDNNINSLFAVLYYKKQITRDMTKPHCTTTGYNKN